MFAFAPLLLAVSVAAVECAKMDLKPVATTESLEMSIVRNCSKHSDCNPVLRNLLHLINQEGESDSRRARQEMRAFQTLHRNPKIFCVHSKCQCSEEAQIFDPIEQICRHTCSSDDECSYQGTPTPKGDPMLVAPDDDLGVVAQICAADGLCRCPAQSELDALDQRRCIANTEPLLATSLTIGAIFILLTITLVPVWVMIKKQRAYNRHQRLLGQKATKIDS